MNSICQQTPTVGSQESPRENSHLRGGVITDEADQHNGAGAVAAGVNNLAVHALSKQNRSEVPITPLSRIEADTFTVSAVFARERAVDVLVARNASEAIKLIEESKYDEAVAKAKEGLALNPTVEGKTLLLRIEQMASASAVNAQAQSKINEARELTLKRIYNEAIIKVNEGLALHPTSETVLAQLKELSTYIEGSATLSAQLKEFELLAIQKDEGSSSD